MAARRAGAPPVSPTAHATSAPTTRPLRPVERCTWSTSTFSCARAPTKSSRRASARASSTKFGAASPPASTTSTSQWYRDQVRAVGLFLDGRHDELTRRARDPHEGGLARRSSSSSPPPTAISCARSTPSSRAAGGRGQRRRPGRRGPLPRGRSRRDRGALHPQRARDRHRAFSDARRRAPRRGSRRSVRLAVLRRRGQRRHDPRRGRRSGMRSTAPEGSPIGSPIGGASDATSWPLSADLGSTCCASRTTTPSTHFASNGARPTMSKSGWRRFKSGCGSRALPRRIECCDISHLGGNDTVGAIVALLDGRARQKAVPHLPGSNG